MVLRRLFLVAGLGLAASSASATTVITGSVGEFTGPDGLFLDPSTNVIAVDVYGNTDSSVNGVTFFTGGQGAGSGTATNGGVTVITSAANQIDNWAGAPAFTGGTAGSAGALAEVMRDIRWEANPNPVTVAVSGLTAGGLYDIQLLFNEGGDRDRHFDIGVDGNLVVDNMTSEGVDGVGVWNANNSFFYRGQFMSGDGTFSIALQEQIGGDLATGLDNNPILQGVIIHQIPEPSAGLLAMFSGVGLLFLRRRR